MERVRRLALRVLALAAFWALLARAATCPPDGGCDTVPDFRDVYNEGVTVNLNIDRGEREDGAVCDLPRNSRASVYVTNSDTDSTDSALVHVLMTTRTAEEDQDICPIPLANAEVSTDAQVAHNARVRIASIPNDTNAPVTLFWTVRITNTAAAACDGNACDLDVEVFAEWAGSADPVPLAADLDQSSNVPSTNEYATWHASGPSYLGAEQVTVTITRDTGDRLLVSSAGVGVGPADEQGWAAAKVDAAPASVVTHVIDLDQCVVGDWAGIYVTVEDDSTDPTDQNVWTDYTISASVTKTNPDCNVCGRDCGIGSLCDTSTGTCKIDAMFVGVVSGSIVVVGVAGIAGALMISRRKSTDGSEDKKDTAASTTGGLLAGKKSSGGTLDSAGGGVSASAYGSGSSAGSAGRARNRSRGSAGKRSNGSRGRPGSRGVRANSRGRSSSGARGRERSQSPTKQPRGESSSGGRKKSKRHVAKAPKKSKEEQWLMNALQPSIAIDGNADARASLRTSGGDSYHGDLD